MILKEQPQTDSLDKHFEIQLGNLPNALRDKLSEYTKIYTIPLILDSEVIGSGTLIRLGDCAGILTAAHVIRNDSWRIDCSTTSKQRLYTSLNERTQELYIQACCLELERTTDASYEYGPDLGFIRLGDGRFVRSILREKRFLDILSEADKGRKHKLDSEPAAIVVAGFADVYRRQMMPEPGFETVQRLQGHGFLTGQEHYERRGEYDYVEVGAAYDQNDEPPITFNGVSGGGFWQVSLFPESLTEPYDFGIRLTGVQIYETPIKEDFRYLRGHGPESLYRVFLPRLIDRFM
jgi:hypothetical protein